MYVVTLDMSWHYAGARGEEKLCVLFCGHVSIDWLLVSQSGAGECKGFEPLALAQLGGVQHTTAAVITSLRYSAADGRLLRYLIPCDATAELGAFGIRFGVV